MHVEKSRRGTLIESGVERNLIRLEADRVRSTQHGFPNLKAQWWVKNILLVLKVSLQAPPVASSHWCVLSGVTVVAHRLLMVAQRLC